MTYKVIALSVGGKNNKIFKSGDIVVPSNFSAPIQDLVDGGFIEMIDDTKKTKTVAPPVPAPASIPENGLGGKSEPTVDEADYTKKNVESVLKLLGIEFEQKDKKTVLWNLLFHTVNDNEKVIALLNAQKS